MERYLVVRNKQGELVPYRLNTVQQHLAQYVAECWHLGIPVKVFIPKSRQMGISLFFQGLFYALAELFPGYQVAVVAHDEAASREIFSKSKLFYRQIPKMGWHSDLIEDQAGSMKWRDESAIFAATIKSGDALLKGFTLQAIHWSEAANFADKGVDAANAVASAQPALAQNEMTIEVYESTAKGKDGFYWPRCEQARDPQSGSEYGVVFLPWFLMDEYSLDWETYRQGFIARGKEDPGPEFVPSEEEVILRRTLSEVDVKPTERWWRYRYDLSDAQLIWRRAEMAKPWCKGREELFKRYYPSTYEEAFTASAASMFSNETINHFQSKAKDPEHTGNMVEVADGRPTFMSDPRGVVQIWEMPHPKSDYVIGADPGGEQRNRDPSAAYVIERESTRAVAAIHGYLEWDDFADQLYSLGIFYNNALLVVENNYSHAIPKRLHRRNYPNLYYHKDEVTAEGNARIPGFHTNPKTRPELMDIVEEACRLKTFVNPDPWFAREMETFVWIPKASDPTKGMHKAAYGNHDDRIMAAAIGLLLCPRRLQHWRLQGPPKKRPWWFEEYKDYLDGEGHAEGSPRPGLNLARPQHATR